LSGKKASVKPVKIKNINSHVVSFIDSLRNIMSANAPITVAVQKLIRMVNLEPILERAKNNAISPIPNPIRPLKQSIDDA
tara:strand:- start:2173 stop:2412 length:240 start_codon:yes stop_codon:yes gene_type:complete